MSAEDYSQFRQEEANDYKERGLLNKGHLFRVVRTFGKGIPEVENQICGDVVEAFLAEPAYKVVEYVGPNTAFEPDTMPAPEPEEVPEPDPDPKSKGAKK